MKDLRTLFQNELYADVTVCIKLETQQDPSSGDSDTQSASDAESGASSSADDQSDSDSDSNASSEGCAFKSSVLKTFPGHMAILCQSEYLEAQARFIAGYYREGGPLPTLSLTVENASQLEAVEAVIAVLYGVKESISKLQQHQMVHAVQYADLLQLDSVAQQAAQLLLDAARTDAGLAKDTLHSLCKLVWPSCLLPLLQLVATRVKHETDCSTSNKSLQEVLVSVVGNLETVWTDTALSSVLLALPLPAMQLLLSADGLLVYSEDTVLYTAGRYVEQLPLLQQAAAANVLSALIRMQHLSDFQLMAQVINTDDSGFNVMKQYKTLLGYLLSLRALQGDPTQLFHDEPGAPVTLSQPPRQLLQPPPKGLHVNLAWKVSAKDLLQAHVKCCASRTVQGLHSPHATPPLHGMDWQLYLRWTWQNEPERAVVGAYVKLNRAPKGAYVRWSMQISCLQAGISLSGTSKPLRIANGWGTVNVLGLGASADEWDESVWVSKGLPVDGDIEFAASVSM